MQTHDYAEPEPSLVRALERATHDVGEYLQSALADLGLTQAEIHVMSYLAAAGPSSIGAIHGSFGHRRSTLTSVLDRLERRGLVTRAINSDDRRSFVIAFTEDGEAASRRVVEVVSELEARALARMGTESRRGFLASVAELNAAIEDLSGTRG